MSQQASTVEVKPETAWLSEGQPADLGSAAIPPLGLIAKVKMELESTARNLGVDAEKLLALFKEHL